MSQDETAEDVQRHLNLESEEQVRELRRRDAEQMRKEATDIDAVYTQRELEQRNQRRRDGSMTMGDLESSAFRTSAAAHFAPTRQFGQAPATPLQAYRPTSFGQHTPIPSTQTVKELQLQITQLQNLVHQMAAGQNTPAPAQSPAPVQEPVYQNTIGTAAQIHRTGDIPKAPIWVTGGGMKERRDMFIKYQSYIQRCRAQSTPTNQIVPLQISLCMSVKAQEFLARCEFDMEPHQMTDQLVMDYFQLAALQTRREGLDDMKKLIKASVKMPTGGRDAADIMSKWKWQWWDCLDKVQYTEFPGDHPKEFIKILVDTIRPDDVRDRVKNEIEGEFKHFNKSVGMFTKLVHDRLEQRLKFMPFKESKDESEPKTPAPKPLKPPKDTAKPKSEDEKPKSERRPDSKVTEKDPQPTRVASC